VQPAADLTWLLQTFRPCSILFFAALPHEDLLSPCAASGSDPSLPNLRAGQVAYVSTCTLLQTRVH
jgi:hypothetical protein